MVIFFDETGEARPAGYILKKESYDIKEKKTKK